MVKAQEYLNDKYPMNGVCQRNSDRENKGKNREQITKLDLSKGKVGKGLFSEGKTLEGSLKLEGFTSLQILIISSQSITSLDISDCPNLEEVDISNCLELTEDKIISNLIPNAERNKLVKKSKVQEWLDENYPKENRSKVKEIYLNEPNLAGELDLGDFTYKETWRNDAVKVYISSSTDEKKLTFKNKPEHAKVIPIVAERYINYHYFQERVCIREKESWSIDNKGKKRKEIKELNISKNKLEGKLNLNDFTGLEKLNCSNNKLTILDVSNCKQLKELNCYENQLTKLILPGSSLEMLNCSDNLLTDLNLMVLNSKKLTFLSLYNNNFTTRDLSCFSRFTQLGRLYIGTYYDYDQFCLEETKQRINQNLYNRWIGSLKPLKDLNKLYNLDIPNTDISEGVEYLPSSLNSIGHSTKLRPDCKLTALVPWLDKYFGEFNRCLKCGLANTSLNWCQPCAEREWKQLTGQELVEKFIEQQGKYWLGKDKLPWIPYEEFTEIKYLAEGGFSKVYKAECKELQKYYVYTADKEVALKIITNSSQNLTLEFLQEIANTKLVDGSGSNIVQCYGISQDPITNNYVMVMQYMEEGNLREYLKNNYSKLSWEDKLYKLRNISGGLYHIHYQNLVHRDFHSGNILNGSTIYKTFVTDLGLSKLVNSQLESGKIMGVLPYIAPEVLRGQPYTKASDVYSFGIITYELLSNLPPYYDKEHDISLTLQMCQGLRPTFRIKIPALLEELINKCWDADPKQRPSIEELYGTLKDWDSEVKDNKNTKLTQQIQEAEKYNQSLPENIRFPKYEIHQGAIYTSRLINTKQITDSLDLLGIDISKLDIKENNVTNISSSLVYELESEEIPPIEIKDWTSLHTDFNNELIKQWQSHNFSYEQTRDWISIGLEPADINLAVWLRDTKQLTSEQVLNHHNLEQLRIEFFTQQLQTHIEQLPK